MSLVISLEKTYNPLFKLFVFLSGIWGAVYPLKFSLKRVISNFQLAVY